MNLPAVGLATHLLQDSTDGRTIQTLLDYEQLRTTMQFIHVLEQSGDGVPRPLDISLKSPLARRSLRPVALTPCSRPWARRGSP
ncbi:hypothetical protein [Salinibacter grassmerensis]|uniref:hypothetical protein n=1 Tax=Salinibacter grassmerensis TaxID=3040353 RepID=UPI0021E7F2CE|nr:hypothetical protein [Salinibacter grassmerensis]